MSLRDCLSLEAPASVSPAVRSSSKRSENFFVATACCSGVPLAAATTSVPAALRAAAEELSSFCSVWYEAFPALGN